MASDDRIIIKLGDVVEHLIKNEIFPPTRGIVVWEPGCERVWPVLHHPVVTDTYVIKFGSGSHSFNPDPTTEWRPVPTSEWTTLERVQSVLVSWEPMNMHDPDDNPPDYDTLEWQLLMALLPPHAQEYLFEHDTPDLIELAVFVAGNLDDRLAGARTLGSALARIGV